MSESYLSAELNPFGGCGRRSEGVWAISGKDFFGSGVWKTLNRDTIITIDRKQNLRVMNILRDVSINKGSPFVPSMVDAQHRSYRSKFPVVLFFFFPQVLLPDSWNHICRKQGSDCFFSCGWFQKEVNLMRQDCTWMAELQPGWFLFPLT